MEKVSGKLSDIGIVPVITGITDLEECENLAGALVAGGIPVMEITFRMERAESYIRYLRECHPEILVGAGTVLTVEQARTAIDAGAQFLVSPGLNKAVVRCAGEAGVEMLPGIATPSELEQAMEMGLRCVKFFPAEQAGGVGAIKAMSGPYRDVRFVPTGGINLGNLADYFACESVAACGGTYMLGKHLQRHEWEEISALCRRSVQTMLGLRLSHIGICPTSREDAGELARQAAVLLGMDVKKDGGDALLVGEGIKVMRHGGRGHIAYSTPCLERAVRYLNAVGCRFLEASERCDDRGMLAEIAFEQDIAGFEVRLVQK